MAKFLIGNIKGEKGDTGNGLTIKEFLETTDQLPSNPEAGDVYGVKNADGDYEIHIYSPTKGWVNNGALAPDIDHQAPHYEEATTLESLTSGEKISIAFGKIKKAIKDLISHLGNKENPHGVTASQVGAVALGDNVVTGDVDTNNTTKGGVRFGIVYAEEGIPFVGMGTERGTNNLILASGCDYTDEHNKNEIGEYAYYFPVEVPDSVQSYPVALKVSYYDGKLYFLRSSNGKRHYAKNEIIPMETFEVIHSGNIRNYIKEECLK